jgi:hypothetical protein
MPAFFASAIALGWIAVSPAQAGSGPQCINVDGERYCMSNFYTAGLCIHRKYSGVMYVYCRKRRSGGSGGSGY